MRGRYSKGALFGVLSVFVIMVLVSLPAGIIVGVFLGYTYIANRVSSWKELYENQRIRSTITGLLIFVVPMWAYIGGDMNADRALRSDFHTYVRIADVNHRYLGSLGGYAFLAQSEPDRVLIINLSERGSLELIKHPNFPDRRPNFQQWWLEPNEAQKTNAQGGESKSRDSKDQERTAEDSTDDT